MEQQAGTLYEAVGGSRFFEELVDRFYDRVSCDPDLVRVYPTPEDLSFARRKLALFLAEYWGGPSDYSDLRGHPRLRLRHFEFEIGQAERDRWVEHMGAAVEEMAPTPKVAQALMSYFDMGASALVNR